MPFPTLPKDMATRVWVRVEEGGVLGFRCHPGPWVSQPPSWHRLLLTFPAAESGPCQPTHCLGSTQWGREVASQVQPCAGGTAELAAPQGES